MRRAFAFLRWMWRERLFWFLRTSPAWEFSTRIYEGLPGSGKTLAMVRDAVDLMRSGVVVYSNLSIVDRVTGLSSRPLGSWLDMLRGTVECLRSGERVVFAIDEIHLMCDARNWRLTPDWWMNLMAQRRHYSVGLIGTTQDISTVEKRLRTLVRHIIRMQRLITLPGWIPGSRIINRLAWFVFRELDGRTVTDSTPIAAETGTRYISWMPWYAFAGYSTIAVMASDSFAAYTDEEAIAEIARLTEEARSLCSVWEPSIFAEVFDAAA